MCGGSHVWSSYRMIIIPKQIKIDFIIIAIPLVNNDIIGVPMYDNTCPSGKFIELSSILLNNLADPHFSQVN